MILSFITALHLAALSQIESGDRDGAVGRYGEVSRYQIMPAEWHKTKVELRIEKAELLNPKDATGAAAVATELWNRRVKVFELAYGRPPSLQELYLCWHRPGRVLNPKARELERARRFENVYGQLLKESIGRRAQTAGGAMLRAPDAKEARRAQTAATNAATTL